MEERKDRKSKRQEEKVFKSKDLVFGIRMDAWGRVCCHVPPGRRYVRHDHRRGHLAAGLLDALLDDEVLRAHEERDHLVHGGSGCAAVIAPLK